MYSDGAASFQASETISQRLIPVSLSWIGLTGPNMLLIAAVGTHVVPVRLALAVNRIEAEKVVTYKSLLSALIPSIAR